MAQLPVRRRRQGISSATSGAERPLPDWLNEADLAFFTEAYRKSGFRGGLNWYRNLDRNWELTAPWQDAQIHQPSLFIAGSKDSAHHRPDRRASASPTSSGFCRT